MWDGGWGVVVSWKRHRTEMGQGQSPPADSGSFCEAVGLVSEAHGVELNEETEPMGAR